MKNQSLDRLEIFLLLALRQQARNPIAEPTADFMLPNVESGSASEISENPAIDFPAIFDYLDESDAEKFRRLLADYQNKTEAEKKSWHRQTRKKIGADEPLLDEQIHHSHVNEALQKEIPRVQRIVAACLPLSYRKSTDSFTGKRKKTGAAADFDSFPPPKNSTSALARTVRRQFAKQFVRLADLNEPTAFDVLTGAQLARLIRLAGIRETALACVRIEAVESVAAFLRRFSAEDAQAIAAQLSNLTKVSDERLAFAEQLVPATLETEPQPSAMLDLLGIRQIAARLFGETPERINYTNQKLPLEIKPQLRELIDEQRDTPAALRAEISREIERLAETLAAHAKR